MATNDNDYIWKDIRVNSVCFNQNNKQDIS